jgi:tetratricopeptide (TPR) repeat protein
MWPWFLIALSSIITFSNTTFIHSCFAGQAQAKGQLIAPESIGPLSEQEAETLWREGKTFFDKSQFKDAAFTLRRFVSRYPSRTSYTEANLLLGRSYLELEQPEKAIAPLKYYVTALGNAHEVHAARVLLIEAYLKLERFHEAYLAAQETIKSKTNGSVATRLETMFLEAQALVALNQDSRAAQVLESANTELAGLKAGQETTESLTKLKTKQIYSQLKLKIRTCSRLPSSKSLDEGQVRNQMDRRGRCLSEATLFLAQSYRLGSKKDILVASNELTAAFKTYSQVCTNPPPPPGKRSRAQIKQYRAELTAALREDCKHNYSKALELLSSSASSLPEHASNRLKEDIQGLTRMKDSL